MSTGAEGKVSCEAGWPGRGAGAGAHLWTGRRRGCTGSTAGRRPPSSGRSSALPRVAGSSTGTACEERGVGAALGAPRALQPCSHRYSPLPARCPSPLMGHGSAPGPLRSPQGLHEVEVSELVQLHEGMQDLDVELVPAGTKPEHEGCMISKSCDCRAAPRLPAPLQTLLICGGKPAATATSSPGLVCTHRPLASASHGSNSPPAGPGTQGAESPVYPHSAAL